MSAATDWTFTWPGQSFTFLKNILAIEAGGRCHNQAPVLSSQGFLQMLEVVEHVFLCQADGL